MSLRPGEEDKMFERGKYGPGMFFYDISHGIVLLIGHLRPPRKYDMDGKPFRNAIKDSGMIIVANHVSYEDPWYYSAVFSNRRMFYLASELFMKNKLKAFLCRYAGCIEINRQAVDIEAIRRSTDLLKNGRALLVFPEGYVNRGADADLSEIKGGAILLANQAGVPIVPCYSLKQKHWYNRRTVVVGKPFNVSDYTNKRFMSVAEMDKLAENLMEHINELRKVYERLTEGR